VREGKAAQGEQGQVKGEQRGLEESGEGGTATEKATGICPLSLLFRLLHWELGLRWKDWC